ncbi:Regulator of nonsense transcripts 1 [Hypsizygus marmoreus]|uniref:Regulator of nonsense transcripts 1 n=1 Tax=Hypsizygus marmoreus TaxID=39966 RepID=A0A369K313_HYPMA|nr:Regulator of nonsense transcripts 1 [Hypsizygus marmoreus]
MAEKSFDLAQQIFKKTHLPVRVDVFHESNLGRAQLDAFLQTIVGGAVGVAPSYGSKCILGAIALASTSHVLFIRLSSPKSRQKRGRQIPPGRALLQDLVFCSPTSKYAFKLDKLAVALYHDIGLRITNGIDLLSVAKADRHSFEAILQALGGETMLNKSQVSALFKHEENAGSRLEDTVLQAWAACQVASLDHMQKRLTKISRVDTLRVHQTHLSVLSKTLRDSNRLLALKPTRVKNDIDNNYSQKHGNLQLVCSRFKTRIMHPGNSQTMEIQTTGQQNQIKGRTTKVTGRAVTISLQGVLRGDIRSVTTIGREDPTSAEAMRGRIILKALQGDNKILKQPFVQRIWLPSDAISWAETPSSSLAIDIYFPSPRALNRSQNSAVTAILSSDSANRTVLIHGPPGTGKTTVIAAAVTSIVNSADRTLTVWLVAQSNVAVKNIAEKLADVNFFDFKLLVSKDFHYDWHEHLYEQIEQNVIRSDDFVDDVVAMERLLLGSQVILCTLSMLSHARLSTFARLVPPRTMIFDEASQIEIGDYFPPLHRFCHTLRKLVFIGDDKQLAPYGESDVEGLCSVFEKPHLRNGAVFLDTQYRMPVPIGNFISRNVYSKRLKSVHEIKAASCCSFVNVPNGREERKGFSWVNTQEIRAALKLARLFHATGKSYRIITPYDAQRSQLENGLKAEKVPWQDRCFNVDSFQGNEADHIILSLVRSEKIGFMKETRRVNVMLTRCKKSMIILTSREFVEGKAASSLIGKLAKALGPERWVEVEAIFNGSFRAL